MRRPVMAGNWKMFKTAGETRAFIEKFKPLVERASHCEIVLCPPFTSLGAAAEAARGSNLAVGAQDMHWEKKGAFTGEVTAAMLVEAGCRYVILGHSERRELFHETDELVSRKLAAALEAGLTPIVCVGEKLAEREAAATETVLTRQFAGACSALTAAQFSRIIIAYEPVWAISSHATGTESTSDMLQMGIFIRKVLAGMCGKELANKLPVLYGGSADERTVADFVKEAGVDGFLVGKASLFADSFSAVIKNVNEATSSL